MQRTFTIESLEARQLLSASPVQLHKGMLKVQGTRESDVIILSANNHEVTVELNGAVTSFDRAGVRGVRVDAGAASDTVEVAQGEGHGVFDIPVTLHGGGGADMLSGGAGNDVLDGGADDDYLFGMDGHDTLAGGRGNDLMSGGAGNDFLFGGKGNDTMGGGEGDDHLHGGPGIDELYGEGGKDVFFSGTVMDAPVV
jgi:Ca2+-binding RTX toxin-like protein